MRQPPSPIAPAAEPAAPAARPPLASAQSAAATRDAAPRPAPGSILFGIVLLVVSLSILTLLDAGGKWVMMAGVPLVVLCWVRYAVHLALALAVILPARGPRILRSRRPSAQITRGTCMVVSTSAFFTTLRYLPQAEATAINFLAPLLVLATAPWVLREPPRLSRWIAAGVGLLGVLVVIRPGAGLHPLGTLIGLGTACCFAAQYISTRRVAIDDPLTSLVWSGAVGTALLTLALPFVLPAALPVLAGLEPLHWAVLASTGVLGCVGHLLQIVAYRNAPASALAPFIYLQIVSAASVSWLIWGDFPDAVTWLGIAIICSSGMGIGVLEWRRSRGAQAQPA